MLLLPLLEASVLPPSDFVLGTSNDQAVVLKSESDSSLLAWGTTVRTAEEADVFARGVAQHYVENGYTVAAIDPYGAVDTSWATVSASSFGEAAKMFSEFPNVGDDIEGARAGAYRVYDVVYMRNVRHLAERFTGSGHEKVSSVYSRLRAGGSNPFTGLVVESALVVSQSGPSKLRALLQNSRENIEFGDREAVTAHTHTWGRFGLDPYTGLRG